MNDKPISLRQRRPRSREHLLPDEVAKLLAAAKNPDIARHPERDYCLLLLMAWRKKNGMSQRSAAQVLNDGGVKLPLATYQKYEGGFLDPGRWALAAIEKFLDEHRTVTDPPKFGRWRKPLSDEQKAEMRKLRAQGVSLLSLAERFQVTESGASRICSNKPRTRTAKTPKASRTKPGLPAKEA